jgi:signal peptidase II
MGGITGFGGSLIKYLKDYAFLVIVAGTIVAMDRITKSLVLKNLAIEEFWSPWPWLEPYARIVHWKNTGAAFGMLPGFGDVFMVLAILVSLAILYYFPQVPREDWPLRLAMGLQMGGAVGNLIDRLTIGYVVDFISVGNFPVFNIADASISVGVTVLILGVWIKERAERSSMPGEGQDSVTDKSSEPVVEETWGE